MSNIDKQALREAAEKAGSDEWCAFIDTKSKTYAVHTPADNRCGDVVKWAGFDGQQRAAAKAKFIAAANPAIVLNLLDELEAKDQRIAELEAREVVLPSTQDVHPLGPQSAKIFCEFHRSIVNRCADEIRKVGVKVSIKGN
ncbi:ead/Ea22-like family protein [Enterobacter cloacae complex sp. ZZL004]|uniref:ead/Ea22-like family protein n=1 Tax=Enterobacter cloacae complex sp. ZZL004 TaxID=3412418 RepID=UPI003B9A82B6